VNGAPAPPESRTTSRLRRSWALVVLVGLLVAGALAGVLWWALWTPPTGVAFDGRFVLDGPGSRSAFDATASFVLISLAVGLVGGIVAGAGARRDELAVLAAAVGGAIGATGLMYGVGHLLGPPDPSSLATRAADYEPLVDELTVAGWAPLLVLTGALLVGLVVTLLGLALRPAPDEAHHDGGPHPGTGPDPSDAASLDWRRGSPHVPDAGSTPR
jgi:hypothetical protein